MTGRRRLSRKIDWIFRQDEARRCSEKDTRHSFGRIFRPADDETPPLYFVYGKVPQRSIGGKDERWAAVLFILTLVIRDVGSVDGLQASRLPSAGGRWKQ